MAVLVVAGCDPDLAPEPIPCLGCPSPEPPTTPQLAMLRFEASYENQVLTEYEKLFTANFRFSFLNQSDPGLVSTYGNNWGKDDEIASTGHLFSGFTDEQGTFQGPATSIALSLEGASLIDDPLRPDSAAFYKLAIVPSVNLNVVVSGGVEFLISGPHDFYLVRGDAAVLAPGQEARADRWYLHRWADKSSPLAAPLLPPGNTSWGRLKASYR